MPTTTADSAAPGARPRVGRLLWPPAVLLAALGLAATVLREYAPVVRDGPVPPAATFGPQVLERVAAWQSVLRPAVLAIAVVGPLAVAVLLLAPPGRRLLARLDRGRAPTLAGAAVAAAVVTLATTPVRYRTNLVEATAAGLRVGGTSQWLADEALASGLRVAGTALGVAGLLWVVRRWQQHWPAVLTVGATALAAALLLAEPLVTTELTLDPRPLAEPRVLAATEELVARSSLAGADLAVGDASRRTTTLNARVTGLGPTRTIVLHDTLLARPTAETVAVVAHELAHAELDDPLRAVLGTALLTLPLALLARAGLRRRPALPLRGARVGAVGVLALLLAELALAPALHWQSRRVEATADARAVELVGDADGLVDLTRQFVEGSLADPSPPTWWVALRGTHPSALDRIRNATAVEATLVPAAAGDAAHRGPRPGSSP